MLFLVVLCIYLTVKTATRLKGLRRIKEKWEESGHSAGVYGVKTCVKIVGCQLVSREDVYPMFASSLLTLDVVKTEIGTSRV